MPNGPTLHPDAQKFLKLVSRKAEEAKHADDHKLGDKVVHPELGMGRVSAVFDDKHETRGRRYKVAYPEFDHAHYHDELSAHEAPKVANRLAPIKFNAKIEQPSAPPHPVLGLIEDMRPHAGKAVAAQKETAGRQHTERVEAIKASGKAIGDGAKKGAQAAVENAGEKKSAAPKSKSPVKKSDDEVFTLTKAEEDLLEEDFFAKTEKASPHPHAYEWNDEGYDKEDDGIDDSIEGGKQDSEQDDEEDISDGDGDFLGNEDESEDDDKKVEKGAVKRANKQAKNSEIYRDYNGARREPKAPADRSRETVRNARQKTRWDALLSTNRNVARMHTREFTTHNNGKPAKGSLPGGKTIADVGHDNGNGVKASDLVEKAEEPKKAHPHSEAHGPAKSEAPEPEVNEQAGGVSHESFDKVMRDFGKVHGAGHPSDLKFYKGIEKHEGKIDKHIAESGYKVYLSGGKHGKPDLKNKNYGNGHLMIYDPSAGSGGDFNDEKYTSAWRKTHEQAHADTYKKVNELYGEGRRMGKLGTHRSPREMKRAVHWEWLAAHRQREILEGHGHTISDHDFHRELNTVIGDAVHRSITGKFTEPSDFGFEPHSHKVPLEHALDMIDKHAKKIGLRHDNDTHGLQQAEKMASNKPPMAEGDQPEEEPKEEVKKSFALAQEYFFKTLADTFSSACRKRSIPFSYQQRFDGGVSVHAFKVGGIELIHKTNGMNLKFDTIRQPSASASDVLLGKVLQTEIQRFYFTDPTIRKSLLEKTGPAKKTNKEAKKKHEVSSARANSFTNLNTERAKTYARDGRNFRQNNVITGKLEGRPYNHDPLQSALANPSIMRNTYGIKVSGPKSKLPGGKSIADVGHDKGNGVKAADLVEKGEVINLGAARFGKEIHAMRAKRDADNASVNAKIDAHPDNWEGFQHHAKLSYHAGSGNDHADAHYRMAHHHAKAMGLEREHSALRDHVYESAGYDHEAPKEPKSYKHHKADNKLKVNPWQDLNKAREAEARDLLKALIRPLNMKRVLGRKRRRRGTWGRKRGKPVNHRMQSAQGQHLGGVLHSDEQERNK
jgi:hypothetical protein